MQPEAPASIQPATTEHTADRPRPHPRPSTQHGLRPHHRAAGLQPAGRAGAEPPIAAEPAAPAASRAEASAGRSAESRPLSSRNRVAEYERSSRATPPAGDRDGPAFEVVGTSRRPGDTRSPLQQLPNELLTHACARLAPADLFSLSLVSKRFHALVTGPHAWRSAFAHFFPGPHAVHARLRARDDEARVAPRSERRAFARLTARASWRSEYIVRTRLLRCLSRGKPVQAMAAPHAARGSTVAPVIMYNSRLFTAISHIHGAFGATSGKRSVRFIHGADDSGTCTASDPAAVKVDSWGLSDPQAFLQFADRFPGDAPYGLGPGQVVGVPNPMDVSVPYGMVVGEGSPGGMTYFRSADEMRGRFLASSSSISAPHLGIPRIAPTSESITFVWIAKSWAIPGLTDGLIGILSGSSLGVVTAYSLGSTRNANARDQHFARGELTARWVLSPGVPIIGIAVDNEYTLSRCTRNHIWAVVLNALGELFYLTKFPTRPPVERGARLDDESRERTAWIAGRSVCWSTLEPSRRLARFDAYADASVDGSYSPRTSWDGVCLSTQQVRAETVEIEAFAARKPHEFQRLCVGWDMRRKLLVDFAGDDGHHAGEHVIVLDCGLDENSVAGVKRYSRFRFQEDGGRDHASTPPVTEEWRTSTFSLRGIEQVQISATAIDSSTFAVQTASEDPLLGFSGESAASSPSLTPMSAAGSISDAAGDVPGQRARFFAAGTKLGTVFVWDMRASAPRSVDAVNTIEPVRIIHTDSPEISSLAMSSLYLVHGGNDGLVQAWDPLASDTQPIRTLNSRFSSRARQRLRQAQASPQGVGINMFAAGAICLDPDPTVLRGMVSLGAQLRYWSYSSSAADQYHSSKRRPRRSERGSNNGGERFSGAVRSNLKSYIEKEQDELARETERRRKDSQRLAGRFGTDLMDGSEEEMMAYAAMLSQEAFEQDTKRRSSDPSVAHRTVARGTNRSARSTVEPTPAQSPSPRGASSKTDEELDADMAEAIRQSLATSPGTGYHIPIRHAKPKHRKPASNPASPEPSPPLAGSRQAAETDDLDLAIQLSLAEEQRRRGMDDDAFPGLPGRHGTGKKR